MAAAVAPKAGSAVAAAATAALQAEFGARLRVMRANTVLLQLHAVVRDRETPRERFVFCADQLCQLLLEEAVSALPYAPKVVTTPTGTKYEGLVLTRPVCGVSILRSGEAMEPAFRRVMNGGKIGKILIQRDESQASKPAKLFYSKLPADIKDHHVLLLDPMLATGGSAVAAVSVMLDAGVPQDHITFVNLIAAPEGVRTLLGKFPHVQAVCGMVDESLNSHKYIVPGIGDFGDRYFGTD